MIKENQRLFNQLNLLSDGVIVFLSLALAFFIRFHLLTGGVAAVPLGDYLLLGLCLSPFQVAVYAAFGLYRSFRGKGLYQELFPLFQANVLTTALLVMALFLLKYIHFSRLVLGIFFLLECLGLGLKRAALRTLLRHYRQRGFNQKHILLVGGGEMARAYLREVNRSRELGYHVVGYVAEDSPWEEIPRLGPFSGLIRVLETRKPDEVVATLGVEEYPHLTAVIAACEKTGTKLSIIPYYAQYLPAQPQFDSLNGIPIINFRRIPLDNLGNAALKRCMDVAGALLLILLTSPLMLIAAVGVKLSSPGPVLFKQKRVGRNKRDFYMYKFRSMRVNDASDVAWSTGQDPRKTKFGSLIRKFSVDELPQFFNVLRGDMSLVGPRPELPHFVEQFKEDIPLYMVKHQVRPGITGWAQVCGLRGDTSIEARIRHDIYYIERWSVFFDLKILFLTLFKGIVNSESLEA